MGNYDDIQSPVQGQPISVAQYGAKVKAAIADLDRRVSAYDASTGVGKASSTGTLAFGTTEIAALTIPGFVFRAGYAYKTYFRTGCQGAAGTLVNPIIRKANATPSVGTPFGEFFRYEMKGATVGSTMAMLGTLYLLNATANDITTDVNLTMSCNTGTCTLYATTVSPRFFTIEPAGFASDFTGMGSQVS